MRVQDLDITLLLRSLSRITLGRTLDLTANDETETAKGVSTRRFSIPVREENPLDRKELFPRHYVRDWLREHAKGMRIKHRHEALTNVSWFTDSGEEVPVSGLIRIELVDAEEVPELERWAQLKEQRRRKRMREIAADPLGKKAAAKSWPTEP